MDYQPLAFSPSKKTNPLASKGDGFFYIDATAADGVNTRISITPAGGNAIVLKPGQWFRLEREVEKWDIASVDGTATFTGNIVIGSGDFGDSNINNTFKLDGGFANSVNVNNTIAQRVPVTLDTTQTITVRNGAMAYTNTYASTAASAANTAIQMLAAATNVNGAVLNKFDITGSAAAGTAIVVLAKATAPANIADGDVLFSGYVTANGGFSMSLDITKSGMPQVAAGKGIWYMSSASDFCVLRDALFTVL